MSAAEIAALRISVCRANRALAEERLVVLTWGNVSGVTRDRTRVVIKPSGVPYRDLLPEHMVVVDADGRTLEGAFRPSTDTPTHLALYRAWPEVGGIAHAHSPYAVMFAQARREIPCFGTTHADHFAGTIPLAESPDPVEVEAGYEDATGARILRRFSVLDRRAVPAVLVAGHAAFTWGGSPDAALQNAIALEEVARMAHGTLALAPAASPLESHLLAKHHRRKHGPDAYYGQPDAR